MVVLELVRGEFILRREKLSRSATAAPARPMSRSPLVLPPARRDFLAFTTAAALVHQLMEARDEKRRLKLQRELQAVKLLIVDELGYVSLVMLLHHDVVGWSR